MLESKNKIVEVRNTTIEILRENLYNNGVKRET